MTRRLVALAVLASSIMGPSGCGRGRPSGDSESVETTVEALIGAPHGLELGSPEDKERFERVKQNPAPYVEAIVAQLDPLTPEVLLSDARKRATFTGGVDVLGRLDGPRAGDALAAWFVRLHAAVATATPATRDQLVRLRAVVLLALSPQPREPVVSRILEALPRMSHSERLIPLRYLAESTRGDTSVVSRLRVLHDDPTSPLRGDRTLGVVIGKLTDASSR